MEELNIFSLPRRLEHVILVENIDQEIGRFPKAQILQILQQKEINVKMVNDIGDTALHLVLRNNELSVNEIVDILDIEINRGFDLNIKNKKQETLLHLAVAKKSREIIDYLLQNKVKINVTDDKGNGISHFVVNNILDDFTVIDPQLGDRMFSKSQIIAKKEAESANFVKWLLDKGFDFDCKNVDGKSALHLAIQFNLLPILPILLKRTDDVSFVTDGDKQTLLQLFLKASDAGKYCCTYHFGLKNVKQAIRKFRVASSSPFSRRYDIEIVSILLEKGVPVEHEDRNGDTALHHAINSTEEMDIVEMLLDHVTIFQDEYGTSLLCTVLQNANNDYCLKIVRSLIAKGANVNGMDKKNRWTPVESAVIAKNLLAVELLKEHGADFSVESWDGGNLLHALAFERPKDKDAVHCQEEICNLLISEGCDVDGEDLDGMTPLDLALDHEDGDISFARTLVAHGANVNCRGIVYRSPLIRAISAGRRDLVNLLLDNGANANGKSWHGRPVHRAAKFNKASLLIILLKHKAEVNAHDLAGNSALVEAVLHNYIDIVKDLLEHGADINDNCVIHVLSRYSNNSAGDLLLQYWLKLEAADLSCSKTLKYLITQAIHQPLYRVCLNEVKRLKSTYIDSRTSLYQWLHMDPNRRYIHSHNEKLRSLIDSPKFVDQFPQYSTVILSYYRETEARRQLLEPAKKVWFKLIKIDLPDICLERIFAHLNTGYLFEFIEQA